MAERKPWMLVLLVTSLEINNMRKNKNEYVRGYIEFTTFTKNESRQMMLDDISTIRDRINVLIEKRDRKFKRNKKDKTITQIQDRINNLACDLSREMDRACMQAYQTAEGLTFDDIRKSGAEFKRQIRLASLVNGTIYV